MLFRTTFVAIPALAGCGILTLVLLTENVDTSVYGDETDALPAVDFTRDIHPILSNNCFQCHGPDASKRKAGLRLDIESDAKADMGKHRAVAPGRPDQSELLSRILHSDPDERMPPADSGKALSSKEIAIL